MDRRVREATRSTPTPIEGHKSHREVIAHGGHSMRRPGLAERIISESEFYCGWVNGGSGHYQAPSRRAYSKTEHYNTIKGQLRALELSIERGNKRNLSLEQERRLREALIVLSSYKNG